MWAGQYRSGGCAADKSGVVWWGWKDLKSLRAERRKGRQTATKKHKGGVAAAPRILLRR